MRQANNFNILISTLPFLLQPDSNRDCVSATGVELYTFTFHGRPTKAALYDQKGRKNHITHSNIVYQSRKTNSVSLENNNKVVVSAS
jgi:hypothetical protein